MKMEYYIIIVLILIILFLAKIIKINASMPENPAFSKSGFGTCNCGCTSFNLIGYGQASLRFNYEIIDGKIIPSYFSPQYMDIDRQEATFLECHNCHELHDAEEFGLEIE